MALHHLTLKAALNKYGPLFSNGMTVEELVKSISNDEKGFTKDEVAEIIEAIKSQQPSPAETAEVKPPSPETMAEEPKELSAENKDEVAEIIEADGKAFIVLSEFRDKNDFSKIYSVGQDVSHLDSKVLQSLVERNLVELK